VFARLALGDTQVLLSAGGVAGDAPPREVDLYIG
jgi:hypothetical protein